MQLRSSRNYRKQNKSCLAGLLIRLVIFISVLGLGYLLVSQPAEATEMFHDVFDQIGDSTGANSLNTSEDRTADLENCDNAYSIGNYEEAITSCRVALETHPNDIDLYFRLAHTLIITSDLGQDQDRLAEAIEIATQAINADPESPLGYAILAMALDWSGQQNEALAMAERAQEIDPEFTFSKAIMANIFRNLDMFEEAQVAMDSALQDIESGKANEPFVVAQVYRNYGRYLVNSGEFEAAIEPYNLAIQAMPAQTYIAVELASNIYYVQGDYAQVITILEDVQQTNPNDRSVLYWLALSRRQQGEWQSSIQLLTTCVNTNPEYLPCLSALGYSYFWNQPPAYEQAISPLEKATEINSTDPYDWYMLARSYTKLGQCEKAVEPLRQGYQIVQTTPSDFVTPEQFINAGLECSLELQ